MILSFDILLLSLSSFPTISILACSLISSFGSLLFTFFIFFSSFFTLFLFVFFGSSVFFLLFVVLFFLVWLLLVLILLLFFVVLFDVLVVFLSVFLWNGLSLFEGRVNDSFLNVFEKHSKNYFGFITQKNVDSLSIKIGTGCWKWGSLLDFWSPTKS